ncbi:hypothetical protein DFR24_1841 [Panacagrimonas perspica]|uniref:Uncharacterized protein n=1 Tax=Panacagrimonas perspica TaxID=381431 RepID=A0A4R7PE20_9GAMM|nr:hypothetical protein [Panacagrimonas perspica]TDU32444.1 hypothetical protein DFR24_1841 [Panacagrimonas perspica]THD05362.1 hypothetical protein B1810_01085 [Panacagrimonas perspica]
MSLARLLVIVALIAGGMQWWNQRRDEKAMQALATPGGFLPVPMPDGTPANTVLVFAPLNCPREGAQRAKALAQSLADRGIPVVKTDHYAAQAFEPNPETEAAFKRLNVVMTGEIPIVLVNGMGKANPSADEVGAEFRRTHP